MNPVNFLDTRVKTACIRGNWEELRRLVEVEGADLRGVSDDHESLTAIQAALASRKCNLAVLEWMTSQRAPLGVRDTESRTEIMWALMSGKCDVAMLRWLRKNGVPFGVQNRKKMTELMYACWEDCGWDVLSYLVKEVEKDSYVTEVEADGWTALKLAVMNGASEAVQWFIKEAKKQEGQITKQDIDFQNKYGLNALMLAIYLDRADIVRSLIDVADCNSQDKHSITALMYASYYGKANIVKMLIPYSDINIKNMFGETALHIAIAVNKDSEGKYDCWRKLLFSVTDMADCVVKKTPQSIKQMRLDVVKAFIKGECDLNVQDQIGRTPFYLACSECDDLPELPTGLDIAKHFYDANADITICDYNGISPVMAAASSGNTAVIQWFVEDLKTDVDCPNEWGESLLIAAARTNQADVVQYLIDRGCNVNQQNYPGITALIAICEAPSDSISGSDMYFQHQEVARKSAYILLDKGADASLADKDGQIALHKAAQYGHIMLLEKLLEKTNNPHSQDNNGNTALHIALQHHNWGCATTLTNQIENIDLKNKLGKTPLHESCHQYSLMDTTNNTSSEALYFISYLLSKGADVNTKDITKTPVIFNAIESRTTNIAEILVGAGANILAVNCLGQSILHKAVEEEAQARKVSWILDLGVNINDRDYFGFTPLHQACLSENETTIRLLVERGADVLAKDRNNITPFILSAKCPQSLEYIIAVLIEQGLSPSNVVAKCNVRRLLNFAHCFNTYSEVKSKLVLANIKLPNVDFDKMSISPSRNDEEYKYLDEWVKGNSAQYPNRLGYFRTICKQWAINIVPDKCKKDMMSFISDVAATISFQHPALAFQCKQSGSVGEGTKVFQPDEFDFLCNHDLGHRFQLEGKPASPFVALVCIGKQQGESEATHCKACIKLHNMKEGDVLNRNELLSHFYGAWADALDNPELWAKHPSIYRRSAKDILPSNCHISCLEVAIHNDDCPWVEATIDIVSSFPFEAPPDYCRFPSALSQRGCLVAGKWASSQPADQHIFQLGFCLADAEFFHTMPPVIKDGYTLAKIVKDSTICPAIKNTGMPAHSFISSYLLKTITFMIFLHARQLKLPVVSSKSIDEPYMLEVVSWTGAIYRLLTFALQKRYLQSSYIPGYNLLGDAKYSQFQDIAVHYSQSMELLLKVEKSRSSDCIGTVVTSCLKMIDDQVHVSEVQSSHSLTQRSSMTRITEVFQSCSCGNREQCKDLNEESSYH